MTMQSLHMQCGSSLILTHISTNIHSLRKSTQTNPYIYKYIYIIYGLDNKLGYPIRMERRPTRGK